MGYLSGLGNDVGAVMAAGGGYAAGLSTPRVQLEGIPSGEAGTRATLQRMCDLVLGDEGAHHPEVRFLAQKIVEGVGNKDYEGEARAIWRFMRENVRYTLDPRGMEWVQTPWWTLLVMGQGDCFVKGTKVLRRAGHALVPIESLRAGDEVWGRDRWSIVQRTWERGVRSTHLVVLNNGSAVRLTPEHKVWVARCPIHVGSVKKPCSCPLSERQVERITVEELQPKDVVTTPERVPFGSEELDPRRAFVEGLYLADGNKRHGADFSIAGRDGFPREEQKREVQSICQALGVATSWSDRSINVLDRDWTDRVSAMGTLPWTKRALTLDLNEAASRELLRGVLVDSGRNTNGAGRTFTTSSRDLHLQTRVLLKAMGVSCSERFVPDHGSTSAHPVWRLGIRESAALDALGTIRDRAWREDVAKKASGVKREKLLRVKAVVRDGVEADCCDVATDDHYVWLPEADWSTSQCDDHAVATCALATALGHGCAFRTVKGDPERPDEWSHVYPVIAVRKHGETLWLPVDSTEKHAGFGQDPPGAERVEQKNWIVVPA